MLGAVIVLLYALYTVRTRRFAEARSAIERALVLDPLNPRTHRMAGVIAYVSRRYADAVMQYQRALQLNPQMSSAHSGLGDALMALGKMQEARTAYAAEPKAMFRLPGQAVLEHRAGNQPAAERAFAQLVSEVGDAATYQQAEVMAQWGRVWIGHALATFVLCLVTQLLRWGQVERAWPYIVVWSVGLAVFAVVAWYYRFQSGLPLMPLERQIGQIALVAPPISTPALLH